MLGQINFGHALQGARAIRPGGTAREPENGKQSGQNEVSHWELGLVLVHLVNEPVDGDDEETVQHG